MCHIPLKRLKKAMVRTWRNHRAIPIPNAEMGESGIFRKRIEGYLTFIGFLRFNENRLNLKIVAIDIDCKLLDISDLFIILVKRITSILQWNRNKFNIPSLFFYVYLHTV